MLGMYVCNWGLEEGLLEVLASEFTEAPKAETIVVHESYITKVHMRNLQKQGCGLDASLPQFSNTGLFLRLITTHRPFLELNHVLYDLLQSHCWFSNLNHVHRVTMKFDCLQ
jgi:hypothetical protein